MERQETRMILRIALFLGLAVTSAAAADPPGYVVWPKGLPPGGSPQKIQFEHHSWSLAHREKSGVVESHGTRTIVMIVQSGEATLVVGTDIVDAKNTSPTEVRGSSIRNGIERKVSAGDVINMPAGLPHQFLLEPGKQITYIDVVVNTTEK
jgi:mannose-6-phosphate isomerase-like protein (cupin superfamily)